MALVVKLTQNSSATHPDILTLKAESESPTIARSPIIIPLPGGSVLGLDLGRRQKKIVIAGIVDTSLIELFVDNKAGNPFQVGELITGNATWNASVTPARVGTPVALIAAASPSLTAPTSLFVYNPVEFFVDNETITGGTSGGTASVNQPLPTKTRLEQAADYFWLSGALTLTTATGTYTVQISNLNFEVVAGTEDRYNFRLELVQVTV